MSACVACPFTVPPLFPSSLSTVGRIVIIDSPVTDHSLAQQPAPAPAQLQTLPPSVTDLSAPAGAAKDEAKEAAERRSSSGAGVGRDETHTFVLCL